MQGFDVYRPSCRGLIAAGIPSRHEYHQARGLRHSEVTRLFGAGRRGYAGSRQSQLSSSSAGDVFTNFAVEDELNAFFRQQINPTLDFFFAQFVVRDAVHQQATSAVIFLVDRD